MRRTWPFLLAVVVVSAAVGAALARGGSHDSFVLGPTSVVTSTSVEVQSGAPVPGAARTRVVIAGADAVELVTNLHLNVDAQPLQVVTDADSAGDVIVILGM